jgi:DNA-binding beta-propeller fold protein YncE
MASRLGLLPMVVALSTSAGCHAGAVAPGPDAPLVLERTIPLKDVKGRIDHLAVDAAHRRVFVAELGNGSVEAVDVAKGVSLGRINGLKEPQGLAYLPARDELVVASGGDGTVRFYRAADLAIEGVIALGADADNVRVDPRSGRVVVGYGSGGLAVIDPASRTVVARLALPAHPESFQLDGDRVFVNIPDARQIVVGDLSASRIVTTWAGRYGWNFPMAADVTSGTVAVVYRLPARLQVLDNRSGATRSDAATCGDADDVFSDPRRRRLYVVCGSGSVDVLAMDDKRRGVRVATRAGARTGVYSPEWDRLVVAAPARLGGPEADLLVFRPRS